MIFCVDYLNFSYESMIHSSSFTIKMENLATVPQILQLKQEELFHVCLFDLLDLKEKLIRLRERIFFVQVRNLRLRNICQVLYSGFYFRKEAIEYHVNHGISGIEALD